MVDNIYKCIYCTKKLSKIFITRKRTIIIFLLRTLTIIIIPIISSIILLDDCGNGWSVFWSQCYGNNLSKWNVSIKLNLFSYATNPNLKLSDSTEMCGIQPIVWNNCIRQFFHSWT
eukprot:82314_1